MVSAEQGVKRSIAVNVVGIRERIAQACRRVGRDPSEVTLIAVTKTVSAADVRSAYEAGVKDFGENRIQEAAEKIPRIGCPACWHFIGHLQTNKVKKAVEMFDFIHSVDSVKIARAISAAAQPRGKEMPILLQVNISGEPSKYGLKPEEVEQVLQEIAQLPSTRLCGLMTIAPIVADPEEARPFFARLRLLRDELRARYPSVNLHHLSMGMTDDFQIAIEEGATFVRIGRALFGERKTTDIHELAEQ